MATFYLDPEGGNDANDGLSFANRWKTVTSGATAGRIAPGDTIRVISSPAATNTGKTATFTQADDDLTLSAALNALITDCETNWTAAASVTCTTSAVRRTGTLSVQIAIAAGFTTGKVAHFDLGSNQDYSAYQGVTFWIETNAAIASGVFEIKLCSDANGDTPVDTLTCPDWHNAGGTLWQPVYIDKGSALGSAIRSIALYAVSDPGTVTLKIDNISTVKAKGASQTDNLNLTSLISAGASGPWFALREINGAALKLEYWPGITNGTASLGWAGTNGSYSVYKWEVVRYTMSAGSFAAQLSVNDSGSAGLPITFSGGWNRSDMSVQNGETWLDGLHGWCVGWSVTGRSYIVWEKIHGVRWYQFWGSGGSNNTIGNVRMAATQSYGINWASVTNGTIGNIEYTGGAVGPINIQACTKITVGNILSYGTNPSFSGAAGPTLQGINKFIKIGDIDIRNYTWYGIYHENAGRVKYGNVYSRTTGMAGNGCNNIFGGGVPANEQFYEIGDIDHDGPTFNGVTLGTTGNSYRCRFGTITVRNGRQGINGFQGPRGFIKGIITSGNSVAGWNFGSGAMVPGDERVKTVNCSDSTPFVDSGFGAGFKPYSYCAVRNWQGVTDDNRVLYGSHNAPVATITVETGANRHTASGKAWKLSLLIAATTATSMLRHRLGRIYVTANSQVTLRLWVNRSNSGLTTQLVMPKNQIAGVPNDVVDSASTTGSYEELEVLFTPTENGVIEPELRIHSTSTTHFVYFDDLTRSQ